VPGEHVPVAVDQDRDIETKRFNAGGDLSDLFFAVMPWIGGIRFQLVDPAVEDL
jgi:hypothetical protein